jgi:hypothetical protein
MGIASWAKPGRQVLEDAARRILGEELPYGPRWRFAAVGRLDPRAHDLAMLATFGWFDDREFGLELFVCGQSQVEVLATSFVPTAVVANDWCSAFREVMGGPVGTAEPCGR